MGFKWLSPCCNLTFASTVALWSHDIMIFELMFLEPFLLPIWPLGPTYWVGIHLQILYYHTPNPSNSNLLTSFHHLIIIRPFLKLTKSTTACTSSPTHHPDKNLVRSHHQTHSYFTCTSRWDLTNVHPLTSHEPMFPMEIQCASPLEFHSLSLLALLIKRFIFFLFINSTLTSSLNTYPHLRLSQF